MTTRKQPGHRKNKVGKPIIRPEISRFWGIITIYIGLAMIPSGLLGLVDGTPDGAAFLGTSLLAVVIGWVLSPHSRHRSDLRTQDGFIMVAGGWIVGSLWAALPYLLSGAVSSPVDAMFESISGLTTTGSTIFADIEAQPRGILFWRSTTQWLGGMGIIVLAVAILPALGVGGMQLAAAEAPGLAVERLRPRIATTARLLWTVYAILTVIQIVLLWRFGTGMSLFDSINHSFTTMSTGGFSTKNTSVAAFGPSEQWIIAVFIFLGGVNFTLHYRALTGKPLVFFRDQEFRTYVGVIVVATVTFFGFLYGGGREFEAALRASFFQTVSLVTTTGYVSDDYELWPAATTSIILCLLFLGGSAGSTAGGIKQIRLLCLWKAGAREIRQLLHPRGIFLIKINGRAVSPEIMIGVMGFFTFYVFSYAVGVIGLSLCGLDLVTALGGAAASLGNVGPGIGELGATDNYAWISSPAKIISFSLMLIGRLELMTVFVVLASFFRLTRQ